MCIRDRYIPDDEQDESIFSKIITQMKNQYVLMVSSTRKSIVKAERLEKAAENLFSCRNFDELKIPLIITSTDLISGKPLIYSAGSVLDAVVKSSSIPGFIEPTYKDGRILVDGGVTLPTPVAPLVNKCDFIIAVNIGKEFKTNQEPDNIIEIMSRVRDVTTRHLNQYLLDQADFVFNPTTESLHWSAFDRTDDFVKYGHECGERQVQDLIDRLNSSDEDKTEEIIEIPKETFWTKIKKRLPFPN